MDSKTCCCLAAHPSSAPTPAPPLGLNPDSLLYTLLVRYGQRRLAERASRVVHSSGGGTHAGPAYVRWACLRTLDANVQQASPYFGRAGAARTEALPSVTAFAREPNVRVLIVSPEARPS